MAASPAANGAPEAAGGGAPAPAADVAAAVRARVADGAHADAAVARLAALAAVPSCSTAFARRDACFEAAAVVKRWIEDVGGRVDEVSVGFQELAGGARWDLPPVLLGAVGDDPEKATVLVYGAYDLGEVADVDGGGGGGGAPAGGAPAGGARLPFSRGKDGALHGFGLAAGKAALASWAAALDAYRALRLPLPVNVKLMVEGMSASSSECLPDLIAREAAARRGFLTDVDYVVTSAGLWPAAGAPSVVYATRGIATFDVQVAGGSRLLPSGEYAGAVAEPMTDLVQLLATVTAGVHGGVGIDGCGAAAVRPVSPAEQALIDAAAAPTAAAVRAAAGNVPGLIGATDGEVQLNRTRMPAVSVHGVEGAHSGPGVNTVIPAVVSGKFSVRVGPGMDAVAVTAAVTRALEARFKELGSPNELTIVSVASDPWEADPASPLYLAAFRAVERATGRAPVPTRSGHSLPVLNELERRVGAPILVLPLSGPVAAGAAGARAAGAPVGPDDDTVSRADFLTAAVTLATLIAEIAAVHDALGGPDAAATRRRAAAAERGNTGALGRIKEIWKGLA